jgi:hypothetical protein
MKTEEIQSFLEVIPGDDIQKRDYKLDLLPSLARGKWKDEPTAGIGGEHSVEEQISSLVDAILWCRAHLPGEPVLRFIIGAGPDREKVLQALATLKSARHPESKPSVEFFLDKNPTSLPLCPSFENDKQVMRWMDSIRERIKDDEEPKLLRALSDEVGDPAFRWYRGVGVNYWSGRIEGVEVCRVDRRKNPGHLRFVGDKKHSRAGAVAARLLGRAPKDFNESHVKLVAGAIVEVAKSRREGELKKLNYQPEHFYEARILRRKIPLPAGSHARATRLDPVFENRPFQFPAKWYEGDKPRYVDILMREGNVPWVAELKYAKGWYGYWRCFRHAISQAVLYREFIRKTPAVRDLLQLNKGLDATACKALVAFPEPESSDLGQINQLRELAADFDVEVVKFPAEL